LVSHKNLWYYSYVEIEYVPIKKYKFCSRQNDLAVKLLSEYEGGARATSTTVADAPPPLPLSSPPTTPPTPMATLMILFVKLNFI
jgi:hypothetical protein